jgi:hypothetical protein
MSWGRGERQEGEDYGESGDAEEQFHGRVLRSLVRMPMRGDRRSL